MRRIMVVSQDRDIFFPIRRAWVFRSASTDRVTDSDGLINRIQSRQPDIVYYDAEHDNPDRYIQELTAHEETRHVAFVLIYPDYLSIPQQRRSIEQPPHVDFLQKPLRVDAIRDVSNRLLSNVGWYLHSVRMFVVSHNAAFIHKLRSYWSKYEVEIEISREHGLVLNEIEAFQPDIVILDKQSIHRTPIEHYDDLHAVDATKHIPLLLVSHSESRFARRLTVREFDLVNDADSVALGRNWDAMKRYARSLIIANPNPFRTLR